MQLSREQLVKLDYIIERYIEDETIKEASTIKEYLKTHPAKIQELLITVYFNLSRIPTEKERKILNEHKANLFNRLQEKGYIKYEEKRTAQTTKQRLNNEEVKYKQVYTSTKVEELYKDKVEKLNRYSNLIRILEALDERLYLLKEKQRNQSCVQAIDYSKIKTQCSKPKYDFKGIKVLSDIQDTENQIKHFENELKQEKEYLIGIFACIPHIISEIFNLRYIQQNTWKEISNITEMSEDWCITQHNKQLAELDI